MKLPNQLLNKETIRALFLMDWTEEKISHDSNCIVNEIELKIKGIKEPIRLKLLFKEPVEGKLTLHSWSVIRSDIKIGDGRKE